MKRALAIVGIILIPGCSDQVFTVYETYSSAVNDGIISKGWMPSYYPKTAKNIFLVTNVDTNLFVIKAEIKKGDISGFEKYCRPEGSKNDIRYFDDVQLKGSANFQRFLCEEKSSFAEILNNKYVFYSNNF